MPLYLGHRVTQRFVQELIDAFRAGQAAGGYTGAPLSDDQILVRLKENQVLSPNAPSANQLGFASVPGTAPAP